MNGHGEAGDSAFKHALESNKRWAEQTQKNDPEFFPRCGQGQSPKILWIGCSDSRIPETTLLGLKPGDVFTHRNIANIVNQTDINLLSVIQYSVKHLEVKHIVICGHTGCGGVNATLSNDSLGVIDIWLQPMRALREKHLAELKKLEGTEKGNLLAKLNVRTGVNVLRRIPVIVAAMRDRGMEVHGVVYDPGNGILEEVDYEEDEDVDKNRLATFELK